MYTIENIFWTIGLFALVLFLLKLFVFMVTGGDSEVESDFDCISETETSFDFLSVQSVLAFLTAFGWCGYFTLKNSTFGETFALIIAFITGFICMWFSAFLMFNIKKLNHTVKADINELNGKKGRAYTDFAPNGNGDIEITLNNKLSILSAVNVSNEEIRAFLDIKVEKIEDGKIYISKV